MKAHVKQLLSQKDRTIPVLSFPSTQLLGITVPQLIGSAENQARGMQAIAQRCSIGASLNMMDLSVEAEAFGARIQVSDTEIPTVPARLLECEEDIHALPVPQVGAGRSGIYVDGIRQAKRLIADLPIFCGTIGPYSLAGRLFGMTELMMACFDAPNAVQLLLRKCTDFLIAYIRAFRSAGADGVMLAEPSAGLLSPDLNDAFSVPYCREIRDALADEAFVLAYHNCGNTVPLATGLLDIGADIYHFGNAISLAEILPLFPHDKLVMGNVNPVDFRSATPEEIRAQTQTVLTACSVHPHFMASSGCDIPADAKWENIDAYFDAVAAFYNGSAAGSLRQARLAVESAEKKTSSRLKEHNPPGKVFARKAKASVQ